MYAPNLPPHNEQSENEPRSLSGKLIHLRSIPKRPEETAYANIVSILDTLQQAILIFDRLLNCIYANHSVAQILQRPAASLIGLSLAELCIAQPDTTEAVSVEQCQAVLNNQEPQQARWFLSNDKYRWTHWRVAISPSPEGLCVLFNSLISEPQTVPSVLSGEQEKQVFAFQNVLRSEKNWFADQTRLQHLMQTTIVGIFFWRPGGWIVEANDYFLSMIGASRDDLGGEKLNWFTLTHRHFDQQYQEMLSELKQTGSLSHSFEDEIWHFDGTTIPILFSGAFLDKEQQEGVTFVLDLSEQRQIEQVRKDSFLQFAGHELKTPLTVLKSSAQLMKRRVQRQGLADQYEMLDNMDKQINRMHHLINEMLDISRIQAGTFNYNCEPVAINNILNSAVQKARQISAKHCIILHNTVSVHILGDAYKLEQVFINIITNAIKYSPQASKVDISCEVHEQMVRVSIQDYGIGIPAEHKDHVFECFYRVPVEESCVFPGLGIGLYIAHEIIKYHDGSILVESHKGQGSLFCVVLPCLSA